MRRMNGFRRALTAGFLVIPLLAHAQSLSSAPPSSSPPPIELPTIVVTGQATAPASVSEVIDPSIGANSYTITDQQINVIAQGANTSFNQILAHTPGVSEDVYGAIHFRNEDPYYRYYINGTLLPSGINGFSQDIDTRFVQSVTTDIGALPAYFPEGNYGIINITTKSGAALNGGNVSFYGGSNETVNPSFSYGGTSHGTDFYFTGSYLHNDLGLENPTPNSTAIHDETNQYRGMAYLSHPFDGGGRLSFLFSGADQDFQIPNTGNQVPGFDFSGTTHAPIFVNSTSLNETQNEQTYYGFIAYQQNFDDGSFQLSQVNRSSTVKFNPDINGDLLYNGVAASVKDYNLTNSLQADFKWNAATDHTVSFGVIGDTQGAGANDLSYIYKVDGAGNPIDSPFTISDDHSIRAYDWGIYAQDEWKVTDKFTINYGLRFEQVKGYTDESQLSPRINFVYQIDKDTTAHAGYARYFDPPQLLNISQSNVTALNGTTNAPDQDTNDPVKVEKSHYFDLGVTHTFLPGLTTGADVYYKLAQDQIDDGQFGAANIDVPYNFNTASTYGLDFSVDYTHGGFTAYGDFSAADSWRKGIASGQFQVDGDELLATDANEVRFDQNQFYTASAGASYDWMDTTVHVDAIYEDGIRSGFVGLNKVPPYYPVNLGVEHVFKLDHGQALKLRFDVLNVFNQGYVISDGSGIGEGAVKYGNRRSFFGGLSYSW
jgi:outer membrane receptor protein involved in Fe transport